MEGIVALLLAVTTDLTLGEFPAPIHPVVQGTPIDVAELRAIANACDQTGEALQLVRDERARQNAKWHRKPGQWPDSDGTKLAVLLEEVGEVGRELLESGVIHRGKPPQPNLRAELVQVAAVCVAWIETLPPFTAEEQKVA